MRSSFENPLQQLPKQESTSLLQDPLLDHTDLFLGSATLFSRPQSLPWFRLLSSLASTATIVPY